MTDEIAIERSGGNVFAALGLNGRRIELAKACLSSKITAEIAARDWTQWQVADVPGIDQPCVSLLVRGKTGQFSLERLIELLERLSYDVRIEATSSPAAASASVPEPRVGVRWALREQLVPTLAERLDPEIHDAETEHDVEVDVAGREVEVVERHAAHAADWEANRALEMVATPLRVRVARLSVVLPAKDRLLSCIPVEGVAIQDQGEAWGSVLARTRLIDLADRQRHPAEARLKRRGRDVATLPKRELHPQ